jgi:hypothetical protein
MRSAPSAYATRDLREAESDAARAVAELERTRASSAARRASVRRELAARVNSSCVRHSGAEVQIESEDSALTVTSSVVQVDPEIDPAAGVGFACARLPGLGENGLRLVPGNRVTVFMTNMHDVREGSGGLR